jgi:GAF domain-containing protein
VHTASIPVVALGEPGAQKQALLSAGAEECLEPPVAEGDVVTALQRHLGRSPAVTGAPAEILHDPERLSALRETHLLDSDPDEGLDVVTRLAAQVLGVPVALVSLVDDRRQFFKSQVGLPTPWAERRQTPLSHSFCQWVVSSQEELAVGDARIHPVLRTNKAVAELGVIAYAGVPLSAVSGQPIGSFCAIDGKPHPWTEDELATLRDLAQIVDAYTALSQFPASGLQSEARDRNVRTATRAAGRGFLGAARLLRRGRPALDDQQRREVAGIIERHSHQLIEIVGDTS